MFNLKIKINLKIFILLQIYANGCHDLKID